MCVPAASVLHGRVRFAGGTLAARSARAAGISSERCALRSAPQGGACTLATHGPRCLCRFLQPILLHSPELRYPSSFCWTSPNASSIGWLPRQLHPGPRPRREHACGTVVRGSRRASWAFRAPWVSTPRGHCAPARWKACGDARDVYSFHQWLGEMASLRMCLSYAACTFESPRQMPPRSLLPRARAPCPAPLRPCARVATTCLREWAGPRPAISASRARLGKDGFRSRVILSLERRPRTPVIILVWCVACSMVTLLMSTGMLMQACGCSHSHMHT